MSGSEIREKLINDPFLNRKADIILKRQKQALVDSIKEAEGHEKLRNSRLQASTSKSYKNELALRYDTERIAEQERIKHLLLEYKAIQNKKESGELQKLILIRTNNRSYDDGLPKVDRFVGAQSISEVVIYSFE